MEYTSPQAELELTTFVVGYTDYTGSNNSIYHGIPITTATQDKKALDNTQHMSYAQNIILSKFLCQLCVCIQWLYYGDVVYLVTGLVVNRSLLSKKEMQKQNGLYD